MNSVTSLREMSWRSRASLIQHHAAVSTSAIQRTVRVAPHRRPLVRITCSAAPTSLPRPVREAGEAGFAFDDVALELKPLPRKVEGVVDDPTIHNPLERQDRLGTGWMGVICELEGVAVEYETGDIASRAWQQLAQEEGKPMPFKWALTKSEGMKNEQVIQEVFCWSRNPSEVRRLAIRKEELLSGLLGDRRPMVPDGVHQLLDTLQRAGVSAALVSSAPERRVLPVLEDAGLGSRFAHVITADDVHRGKPDPEGYLYAAQSLQRPPLRCVVLGSSNLSVEAAHEVGMKCVAVAGTCPVYELNAADLVVRSLSELSFVNLKQLFSLEESVMPQSMMEEDGEVTDDDSDGYSSAQTTVQVMDRWE